MLLIKETVSYISKVEVVYPKRQVN